VNQEYILYFVVLFYILFFAGDFKKKIKLFDENLI